MESPSPSSPPPRWARAADVVCCLLVLVAVVIAIGGGFRVRLGALRVALTSPYRLVAWALGLGVLRHLLAPRTAVYRDLPPRLAVWWRSQTFRSAALVLLGTRPAVLLIGLLAVSGIGYPNGAAPYVLFDNLLVNLQVRWDAGWYVQIAQEGYDWAPDLVGNLQSVAFFPAYPFIVRVLGRLFGNSFAASLFSGSVVSLAAFLGALAYLYAFARDRLAEDEARFALWLIAAYPFAVFHSAISSESLLLLGTIGAFYHFTHRQFWWAGTWGLLAGLTGPTGWFLTVPLALLGLSPWLPPRFVRGSAEAASPSTEPSRPKGSSAGPFLSAIAAACMPAVGMLVYSAYVGEFTGDPLAWAHGSPTAGGALLGARYDALLRAGFYGHAKSWPHALASGLGAAIGQQTPIDLMNWGAAVLVLGLLFPVAKGLGGSYAIFVLGSMLLASAIGGVASAGRFSAVQFPVFVWLASAVPARHRMVWIVVFAAIQAMSAVLFYTWRPLY